MTGRPHELLLVGYGFRGRQWRALMRRRRDLVVGGIVDPDPEARRSALGESIDAWDSVMPALAERRWDGAIISTPPEDHANSACSCLAAGVPVLIEKPMAPSLKDAARIVATSMESGAAALAAQNFRFLRRERIVRKLLKSGTVGEITSSVISSGRARTRLDRGADSSFMLWNYCLHHIDAVRARLGSAPTSVEARVQSSRVGDASILSAELEWPNGLRVRYEHGEGFPVYHYQEWLQGSRGAIRVSDQTVHLVMPGRRPRRIRASNRPRPEHFLLDAFVGALSGDGDASLTAGDNFKSLAVIDALQRAAAEGGRVAVRV